MREMKDSGVEWIGEIPSDWKLRRNKRVMSKLKDTRKKYSGENVLSLTMNGVIVRDLDNPYGKMPTTFDGYQYIQKGNLLMCLFDIDVTPRCIGLIKDDGVTSPAYSQFKLLDGNYAPYYYYYYLYLDHKKELLHLAKNLRHSFTEEQLGELFVPMPPHKEQKRIADYLDSKCSQIDVIIEKQQAIIEKLKEYKLSVITDAVTKGLNPNAEMKDSGVRFASDMPSNWENRKMLTILSTRVVDGPHESPELYDSGIPYISATAIVNGKIDFSLMRGYISEEYCDLCDKRYTPQRGDLLVVKLGASTGQVAIVDTDERFNIWVPLAVVRCNDEALPRFVYYAFQSDYFIRQMELSWTFGTQQTLGVQTIERLRILLPPIEEQHQIVDFLDKEYERVNFKVEKVQKLIEKLEEYKKSLIFEIVTGKKEV